MSKMGSQDAFEYLKHKLWPKKGLGVSLCQFDFHPLKFNNRPKISACM